jgi:uncharacterized protein (DUF2236 family)
MQYFQHFIQKNIREMVAGGGPPVAFLVPAGDRGLLGPESVAWAVHADFVSMMIGGISSLILQALHPQALAGVWDHSSFRKDLRARLGRTAFFIAATTYGSTEMANEAISRVNAIHQHIVGIDEFGKPYRATDPHLLAWVHLTEITSFWRSYQTYRAADASRAQQDQYVGEMKLLGEKLGALALPDNYVNCEKAIEQYFPELVYSQRTRSIIELIEAFPSGLASRPLVKLMIQAGFYNLPDWAFAKIGRPKPTGFQRLAVEQAIKLAAQPIRAALKDGVAAHARRRVYG